MLKPKILYSDSMSDNTAFENWGKKWEKKPT